MPAVREPRRSFCSHIREILSRTSKWEWCQATLATVPLSGETCETLRGEKPDRWSHSQSTWGHVLYVASRMVVGWQSHRGTRLEVHLKSAPDGCVCSFTPTPEVSSLLSSLLLLLEWISTALVLSCLHPNKGKLDTDVMAGHSEPVWNRWDVVPEEVKTAASRASSQGLQGLHAVGCWCFIERVTRIHFPKREVERFSQRGSISCVTVLHTGNYFFKGPML